MSITREEKLLRYFRIRMDVMGGVALSVIQDDPPFDWDVFGELLEAEGKFRLVRMNFGNRAPSIGFATDALLSAYGIGALHAGSHPALRFRHCLLDVVPLQGRAPVLLLEGLGAFDTPLADNFLAALRSALTVADDQAHVIFACRDSGIRRRLFHREGRVMSDVVLDCDVA